MSADTSLPPRAPTAAFIPGLGVDRLRTDSHSFASRALALGELLSMIGKMLGHNKIDTNARYMHLSRDSIEVSSARVAHSVGVNILDGKSDETAASEAGAASARSFKSSAPTTPRTVSSVEFRSPERAL